MGGIDAKRWLLGGLAAGVFIYAMARARLGPGPRTAVVAGVAFFLGSTLLSLLGWGMLGLYPARMLATWAVIGLVEVVLAALLGGYVYREKTLWQRAGLYSEPCCGSG